MTHRILGYPIQGTASTTPPKMVKGVVSVRRHQNGVRGHFARFPPAFSAPSCRRPSAKRRRLGGLRRTRPRSRRTLLEARRSARQSIREYELIWLWLLQQRLRAVSWPHWRLRCMQPLHGHGMRELSDLDHSHAATPQRVTRASCVQLLRSVLGAACR